MKNRLMPIALFLLVAASAQADWTGTHRDGTQNRAVAIPGITTINGAAAKVIGTNQSTSTATILTATTIYSVERTSAPTATIAAFDKATGAPLAGYVPPALSPNNPNFSQSSPVFVSGDLYFGTNSRVYRIDGSTGAIVWETVLSSANSDPSVDAQYDVVNSSPSVSGDRVFVHTYDSSFTPPYNKSQLVALNRASGSVEWFVKCGGIGTNSPLVFENAGNPLIITHVSQGAGGGMIAYDAQSATPTEVWSSATVGTPWSTTNLFWGDSILVGGKIYGVTYNFSATNGQLVRVDAATGALDWSVASITADCPPVIQGTTIYLHGGPFGTGQIARHELGTGALIANAASPITGVFRNHLTATENYLYLAGGSQGLMVIDPVTYAIINSSAATNLSGPPVIDTDGTIYTRGGGSIHVFDSTSSVGDWLRY